MYTSVVKHNQQGFGIIEGLLILAVIGALIFTGRYIWHRKQTNNTGEISKSLLLEIEDSGSTNSKGWNLLIYSDGSGKMAGSKDFASNTFNAPELKQRLATTKLSPQYDCIRSASFGSEETLIYNNKTIKGIDCYIDSNPNSTLTNQLANALQKAGLY